MPDGTAQDVPKSQQLYQNLVKDGYTTANLGSYDDFNKALQNPITANKIYSGLRSDGYTEANLGTLNDFQTTFSGQKKSPVTSTSTAVSAPTADLSGSGLNPFQSTQNSPAVYAPGQAPAAPVTNTGIRQINPSQLPKPVPYANLFDGSKGNNQDLVQPQTIGRPNNEGLLEAQQQAQDDAQAKQRAQDEQDNPGSWKNTLPTLAHVVGKTVADLGEFGANIIRKSAGLLPGAQDGSGQDLYQKDQWGANVLNDDGSRMLSPYGKMVAQGQKNDPLGSFILGLDAFKKSDDEDLDKNQLPHTFLGNTASGAIHILPDLAAVALMPEASEGEAGNMLDILSNAAKNPFSKVQAAKGAVSGFNKNGVEGAVEGGISGEGSGIEMSLLGDLGGKVVSPKIAQGLQATGLLKSGKLTSMGADMLADATVFGAQPIASSLIQGQPIDWNDVQSGIGTGLGFGSLKALKTYKEHSEVEDQVGDILKNRQGVALKNFMDADPDAIVQAYKSPDSPTDLTAQSIDMAQKTMQSTDIDEKKQFAASSSLLSKTAGVKSTVEAILHGKDGFVKSIQNSELPEDQKQNLIDKANLIEKQFDPVEQKKTALANQIDDLQKSPANGIIAEKEKAVKIKALNKQLDEIITNQFDQQQDQQSGKTITYKKGVGEDEGKFFKTVDGNPEEITQSRYELEKPPKNEANKANQATAELPAEAPKEDAATGENETGAPVNEQTTNNQIKQQNDEINKESGSIPKENAEVVADKNGITGDENAISTGRTEKGQEGNVENSGVPDNAPEPTKIGDLTPEHEIDFNKSVKDLGITADDIKAHEEAINNEQTRNGVPESVQQPENDKGTGIPKSEGNQASQGEPPAGRPEPNSGDNSNGSASVENSEYGTKNAITEALREGAGLPTIEIPKDRTDDESLSAWKDGSRTPTDIIDGLLDPNKNIYDKSITPNDEPILREYIRQLGERGVDLNKIKVDLQEKANAGDEQAKLDLSSTDQQLLNHYDDMERALNASKVGGNIWHKYGAERQIAVDDKGIMLNSINRIKTIYGDEMPADVKKELTELQSKYDNLVAKNEKLEQQVKDGGAKEVFEKSKSTFLGTKKRSEAEFKAAVKDVLGDLKKDWKKSFGSAYATIPGAPQFNAIAPHIIRLMKLYAENGISKLDDVINRIHDDVKDDLKVITPTDIRDIISGKYGNKKPLSQLQKDINELRTQARNKVNIEKLEKGLSIKVKARGEASPEVQALQKQLGDLKKQSLNKYANLSAEDLSSQSKSIQKQIDKGDFFKQPIVKRKWESNPDWVKNNKEKSDLIFKLRKMERDAMDVKKGTYMRSWDLFNRWGRRVIFFGANAVYTKLASAAVLGSFIHRLPEQALGKLNAKMFPNIARNAPIEGTLNAEAEGKFYNEFLSPSKFAKNSWDIIKTGETDLSRELGKQLPHHHIPGIDLLATDGHIIIKDPVKRATFEASLINHLKWYEANGIDPTHPLMLESARQAAFKRAEYEIFQNSDPNSNKIKRFFNELEKSAISDGQKPDIWNKNVASNAKYTAAALYHFFIPVNTVPVNILKRVGLGLKLPAIYLKAIADNKSVRDGVLNMSNEESDAILRQLKKGQISAAYWTLGFALAGSSAGGLYTNFYPNKERDNNTVDPDSDYLNFKGLNISKDVQHNTQFQSLQMGATWGMTYHHFINDNGDSQLSAILKSTAATAGVAAKEHPVIDQASKAYEALKNPAGAKKFGKDLKRRVGINKAQDLIKLMGYDTGDDDN